MKEYDVDAHPTQQSAYSVQGYNRFMKRISWSAVLAGVILSIVFYMLISMLGTAIGAATIDPLKEQNPLDGIGTGASIWMIANMLISCAVGGFVAGRLAQSQGAMHGLLMWGVNTIICAYLVLAVFSSAVTGVVNVTSSSIQAVGNGIAGVAPQVTQSVKETMQESNLNLDDLQDELETALRQTGKPELQPENLQNQVNSAANDAQNTAQRAANSPRSAERQLQRWFNRVMSRGEKTLQAADRDALKNIIKARTGKTDAEVEQIVTQAEQTYQQAYAQFEQVKAEAEQKAREAADKAAAGITKASWFSFFLLIIGGVLAAVAGAFGLRTQPRLKYYNEIQTEQVTHRVHPSDAPYDQNRPFPPTDDRNNTL